MQRRMDGGFRKHLGTGTLLINYAAYRAQVAFRDGQLVFDGKPIPGMWPMDRYIYAAHGRNSRGLPTTPKAMGLGVETFIAHRGYPSGGTGGLRRALPRLSPRRAAGQRGLCLPRRLKKRLSLDASYHVCAHCL